MDLIEKKGRGCPLMKQDLSRAFRHLPVDPGDFNLLGWAWQGWKYFDKSLIMGRILVLFFVNQLLIPLGTFTREWDLT
ncbi:MAG: hypothetical protein JJV94_02575 [Sulfurospirillum sp.]|nr:hypothetical protein [Sulfurospirillum sp.]